MQGRLEAGHLDKECALCCVTTEMVIGATQNCNACPPLGCRSGEKLDLDKERKVRTREEMAAEAAQLRQLFL